MTKERREYPRFSVEIPADVLVPDGSLVRAQVSNISRRGIQLSCDRWTAHRILPSAQVTPDRSVVVKASFDLPGLVAGKAAITVHCRAVFARRHAQDEYKIGLEYSEFEEDGAERIDRFVEKRNSTTGANSASN